MGWYTILRTESSQGWKSTQKKTGFSVRLGKTTRVNMRPTQNSVVQLKWCCFSMIPLYPSACVSVQTKCTCDVQVHKNVLCSLRWNISLQYFFVNQTKKLNHFETKKNSRKVQNIQTNLSNDKLRPAETFLKEENPVKFPVLHFISTTIFSRLAETVSHNTQTYVPTYFSVAFVYLLKTTEIVSEWK